jgi:hypothetical protein
VVESEIRSYFIQKGVPNEHLPFIQHGDTYRGSWILDAAIAMVGTAGTAYTVLKTVSELPEMADGITELKGRIVKKLKPAINNEARENLNKIAQSTVKNNPVKPVFQSAEIQSVPPPPPSPVLVDFVIDARPLHSLTPADLKAQRIHLSVAVSRDAFVLENLGDDLLRDVQLGLFRSRTEQHQWTYQDSYMGSVPLLSAHQTLVKNLGEFRDRTGNRFDISDEEAVFIDCWVSDSNGIYILRFFLDQE